MGAGAAARVPRGWVADAHRASQGQVGVGDQLTGEDAVQNAFLGLYRRWSALQDQEKAPSYVRASVVNGCGMIHRVRYRRDCVCREEPGQAESAEVTAPRPALCGAVRPAACGERVIGKA